MQDRMFDAANILPHRQPGLSLLLVEGLVVRLRSEADEIPAGIGKGIERVGLANRRLLTIGAFHMFPSRVAVERIAGNVKADIFG